MKKYIIVIILTMIVPGTLLAQQGITLSGRVMDRADGTPVDFATVVILEARAKTYSGADGSYSLTLPETGTYTLVVRADGRRLFQEKINLTGSRTRDVYLQSLTVQGRGITIMGERDKQKLSRRTMTREDMKETPASFGDSISALTSLPGIMRTDGFFGPLVIRGMWPTGNRYYVDGMPIDNPQHFVGLHSVINTNLMDTVDLYASAFSAEYGSALAAVIDINTVDNVKEFGGYTDVGLITSSALVKAPLIRSKETGKVAFAGPNGKDTIKEGEDAGYLIVSGRISYLSVTVPPVVKLITGDTITEIPNYGDYQVKFKYRFDSHNSIKFFIFGSKDYWKIFDLENDGGDPAVEELDLKVDQQFHNQGLYYVWQTGKIESTSMVYSSFTNHNFYINADGPNVASWAQEYAMDMKPQIFGAKQYIRWQWLDDVAELRGNLEYTLYRFVSDGKTIVPLTAAGDFLDITDETAAFTTDYNKTIYNQTVGGYLEQELTFGGLKIVPGIRSDHLIDNKQTTLDLRGLASYEFDTGTTISLASGRYSTYLQTNPFLFYNQPDYIELGSWVKPEYAWHNAAGIEQVLGLFTLSSEFYYNRGYDLFWDYPNWETGEFRLGQNSGEYKTHGVELMVRKDRREGQNGVFGWFSYTWNRASYKSGITGNAYDSGGNDLGIPYDKNGNKWITSDFEKQHTLKLVAGYKYKAHTFTTRFQYYTGDPYTPIVGSDNPQPGRYTPVYSSAINSETFEPDYRLDVRYSHQSGYRWGYVKWYVEVINVTNHKSANDVQWNYDKPYSSDNPQVTEPDNAITIIPNFGVEVKF